MAVVGTRRWGRWPNAGTWWSWRPLKSFVRGGQPDSPSETFTVYAGDPRSTTTLPGHCPSMFSIGKHLTINRPESILARLAKIEVNVIN